MNTSPAVEMTPIAHIHTDFSSKFGVPRQSGLVSSLMAEIVFEPEYRNRDAVRGLADFSHIWMVWLFSGVHMDGWSPTVRPPRLGGNERLGVFATRSPFRPNRIGLSSVRLEKIDYTADRGPVLIVSGADLMDGTPILDIKPYLPYADCHPDATGGFAAQPVPRRLQIVIPEQFAARLPADRRDALAGVLAEDPRPSYQDDPERIYGFGFAGHEIRFRVADGILTVTSID